jgi:hypothetical protein
LINKIIKKDVIFSASKENRHYNMYGEKKPRLAVSRGLDDFNFLHLQAIQWFLMLLYKCMDKKNRTKAYTIRWW